MAALRNNNKKKGQKPVYKKKKKAPIISTETRQQRLEKKQEQNPNIEQAPFHPVVIPPTEKYRTTIECIFKKGYFVDALSGIRVFAQSIKEFHVDKTDVPVLLCSVKVGKSENGNLVTHMKDRVFRIVRYNEKEIVGLNSKNVNIWMMKLVKVDDIIQKYNSSREQKYQRPSYKKDY